MPGMLPNPLESQAPPFTAPSPAIDALAGRVPAPGADFCGAEAHGLYDSAARRLVRVLAHSNNSPRRSIFLVVDRLILSLRSILKTWAKMA